MFKIYLNISFFKKYLQNVIYEFHNFDYGYLSKYVRKSSL